MKANVKHAPLIIWNQDLKLNSGCLGTKLQPAVGHILINEGICICAGPPEVLLDWGYYFPFWLHFYFLNLAGRYCLDNWLYYMIIFNWNSSTNEEWFAFCFMDINNNDTKWALPFITWELQLCSTACRSAQKLNSSSRTNLGFSGWTSGWNGECNVIISDCQRICIYVRFPAPDNGASSYLILILGYETKG